MKDEGGIEREADKHAHFCIHSLEEHTRSGNLILLLLGVEGGFLSRQKNLRPKSDIICYIQKYKYNFERSIVLGYREKKGCG